MIPKPLNRTPCMCLPVATAFLPTVIFLTLLHSSLFSLSLPNPISHMQSSLHCITISWTPFIHRVYSSSGDSCLSLARTRLLLGFSWCPFTIQGNFRFRKPITTEFAHLQPERNILSTAQNECIDRERLSRAAQCSQM
ncbi:uncharacterized protein EI90DRAFT_2250063 [Cantharellus anzutake]|uniref:uncharacterized protein n=1 Tax=Cantharellus anzutake TaxID=1750568 RepID=UPI001903C45E|nr:uncharacterized protein EI90DRAFT_2250063 [Cantharellus anzutake]KAF8339542.1 hypothetical protein EI90DRAFT_2250063 [Cantharellus anzutake]